MIVCSIRSRALIGAILCGISASPHARSGAGPSNAGPHVTTRNVVADAIQEGSLRFHIPIAWLRARHARREQWRRKVRVGQGRDRPHAGDAGDL